MFSIYLVVAYSRRRLTVIKKIS